MVEFTKINLNSHVKVKLTDSNMVKWLENQNQCSSFYPKVKKVTLEELISKKDIEGYHMFQLHKYMEIFGEGISISDTNPILLIELPK